MSAAPAPIAPSAPTNCPACGAVARSGARFCAACGGLLLRDGANLNTPPPRVFSASERIAKGGNAWVLLRPLLLLFVLLLASSLVLGLVSHLVTTLGPELWVTAIDALLITGFAVRYRAWLSAPLLSLPPPSRLAESVAVAVVAFVVLQSAFGLLHWLAVPFVEATQGYRDAHWPTWAIFGVISVMPAVFEELVFRGILQTGFAQVWSAREAWLLQAALFSVLHLSPVIFPTHFAMGLTLGWMRWRTGSLYPGMLAHGLWNAWVVMGEL